MMIYCDAETKQFGGWCCGLEKGHGTTSEHEFTRPKLFLQRGMDQINVNNLVEVYKEAIANLDDIQQEAKMGLGMLQERIDHMERDMLIFERIIRPSDGWLSKVAYFLLRHR